MTHAADLRDVIRMTLIAAFVGPWAWPIYAIVISAVIHKIEKRRRQ